MKSENWATVIIAIAGVIGAIVSGPMGYQSGSSAVNKDYVSLAISTLDKKDASPELRKWAVDVLGDLSPVPFGDKLKSQLASGEPLVVSAPFHLIPIPKGMEEECPDLMRAKKTVPIAVANKALTEYDVCRVRYSAAIDYIRDINKLYSDANAKDRKSYEDATGKPFPYPAETAPAAGNGS